MRKKTGLIKRSEILRDHLQGEFKTLHYCWMEADSPRAAFYYICLKKRSFFYTVEKKSGWSNKIFDCRVWPLPDYDTALKFYLKKFDEKQNKKRKRVYEVIAESYPRPAITPKQMPLTSNLTLVKR